MIHIEMPNPLKIIEQILNLAERMKPQVNLDDYFFIVTPSGEVRAFTSLEGFEKLSIFIIKDNIETFADICAKYGYTAEKLSLALYQKIVDAEALTFSSVEELQMGEVSEKDFANRRTDGKSLRDNKPALVFDKAREQLFENQVFVVDGRGATIQVALDGRWVIQVRSNIYGAKGGISLYDTHVIHPKDRSAWDVLKEECGF